MSIFGDINISNLSINAGTILAVIFVSLVVLLLFYISHTGVGFMMRKKIGINIFNRDISSYKNQARILFIDDNDVAISRTLKDEGWGVEKVRDVQIDDSKVKAANIIFVDWKDVGHRISIEDEGMAIVKNIKDKYGSAKYVILYSAREYKKPEGSVADDWLNKGSDSVKYIETIRRACFCLFC